MSVKKLKNGGYECIITLEEGDFDLSTGEEVCGEFEIETFEKNRGTFEEDIKEVINLNVNEISINQKKVNWNDLTRDQRVEIENAVYEMMDDEIREFKHGPS